MAHKPKKLNSRRASIVLQRWAHPALSDPPGLAPDRAFRSNLLLRKRISASIPCAEEFADNTERKNFIAKSGAVFS
jgi:hypothetical protein